MKLLFFGMLTFGYTIFAAFGFWTFSQCGSGGCPPNIPFDAILFAAAAVSVYVLSSLLFWGWRPFKKDRNVQ